MQVSGEQDINEVIRIIKTELTHVLEELSGYDPDEIDGQAGGTGEILEGEEEDDADEEDGEEGAE